MNWIAYIDPGSGMQIFSSMGPVAGFLLAMLGVLFWPVLKLISLLRSLKKKSPRRFAVIMLVLFLAAAGAGGMYFLRAASVSGEKIMILGMDGLDPEVVEQMMADGELPNFRMLKESGSYARLGTVSPPQSPVAWSTFATGLNPGGHGIYDFLWRHTENYLPDVALAVRKPVKVFKLLGLEIPYGGGGFANRRSGRTFWGETSKAGVLSTVLHCPMTFPPEKVSGEMLSGMGVPDIRGTQGTFSFYSSAGGSEKAQGGLRIPVTLHKDRIETMVRGPYDKNGKEVTVPLEILVDRDEKSIELIWEGGREVIGIHQWSPWMRFRFDVGGSHKITGMTRFYLLSLDPEFELYASAFNFTPDDPAQPISYPDDYSRKLYEAIGDYHSLGMPHDTWAMNEGVMSEEMFLEQSETILQEETAMLKKELKEFESGLFVFVIETPDRVQHMFWRAVDEQHPLYTPELAAKYGSVISDIYRRMDEILGLVMGYLDEKTTLIVMSDHGFKTFRRAVHLNSWLRNQGYLAVPRTKKDNMLFQGVDWSRTRAYAVGIGGIFLNMKGRESKGIVEPGAEAEKIQREIARKLKQLKDGPDKIQVVRDVYRADQIYSGAAMAEAPDLLVGFEVGYRASWQTALGASPIPVMEDNLKKWSGDHINDAALVPGIFFSNRKIDVEDPTLYDFAPTILAFFGLEIPEEMQGRPLWAEDAS